MTTMMDAAAELQMLPGFDYSNLSIVPRLSSIAPDEVEIEARITRAMSSPLPFIASPMDSVIGSELAIKLLERDSLPIFHPFFDDVRQLFSSVEEVCEHFGNDRRPIGLPISPDARDWDLSCHS